MMKNPVQQSYNILEIQELNIVVDNIEDYGFQLRKFIYYTATFRSRLKYTDPESNQTIIAVNISCEARGANGNSLARDVIENFFNKRYSNINTEYYDVKSKCNINRNRIDAIECNWDNPELKEMFMHLFDASNWSMEDKTLSC